MPDLESFIIDPNEVPKAKRQHQKKGKFLKKASTKNVEDTSSEDEVMP